MVWIKDIIFALHTDLERLAFGARGTCFCLAPTIIIINGWGFFFSFVPSHLRLVCQLWGMLGPAG